MKIAIVSNNKNTVGSLTHLLTEIPIYRVIWIAQNGLEAVNKCLEEIPDLIIMELMMPIMDGVEACRQIMKNTPCAILLVTTNSSNNTSKIFEAMGYGALDAIRLTSSKIEEDPKGRDELLTKIEMIGRYIGKISKIPKKVKIFSRPPSFYSTPPLLIIGASTGGPAALAKIISHFPKKASFATIIIQHLDEKFADGLARWLGAQTFLPVTIAHNGSKPTNGTILIAGQNEHLVMTANRDLHYIKPTANEVCCPSVDIFFESVAKHWPEKSIAVLLTGMGHDGARGLKTLRDAGWYTIAEDQKSCVVYGMPKAAIALGAATTVLEIKQIGPSILSFLNARVKYANG